MQLASEHILIRIPKTKRGGTEIENYHTQDVIDRYGITPKQVIDMKGLMGDSADNIPGVRESVKKQQERYLLRFHLLKKPMHIEEVEPKRARELLRANKELAMLSKELATIKTDCEIDFSFEDAKYENIFTKEAFEWIKRLELRSLEKRFDPSVISEAVNVEMDVTLLKEKKDLRHFVDTFRKSKQKVFAVGFLGDEWTNTGAVKKKAKKKAAGQLQLVFDQDSMDLSIGQQEEESGYDYPFQAISLSYRKNEEICTAVAFVTEALESQILLEAFCEMEQNAKKIILLNWKNIMHLTTPVEQLSPEKTAPMQQAFDDRDYEKTQLLFTKIFDVSLGGYLLNPMRDSYQVDDIARDYLGKTILSYADCFGKKRIDETMQEEVWQEFLVKEDKDSEIGKKLIPYVANLSYIPLLAQDAHSKRIRRNRNVWSL